MVVYKESLFIKILRKIKKLFKKNQFYQIIRGECQHPMAIFEEQESLLNKYNKMRTTQQICNLDKMCKDSTRC